MNEKEQLKEEIKNIVQKHIVAFEHERREKEKAQAGPKELDEYDFFVKFLVGLKRELLEAFKEEK